MSKQLYLIAYDISNNKKRKKISELLDAYGERINLSVYECMMNQKQKEKVVNQIKDIISKNDIVKIYFICSKCFAKSIHLGKKQPPKQTNVFID
jgi:CRISPR-associated protein Cas2